MEATISQKRKGAADDGWIMRLGEVIGDEMEHRGWTTLDVGQRMENGCDARINCLLIALILAIDSDKMEIDDATFVGLSNAFGISQEFFRKIDANWRAAKENRSEYAPPDHLFSGFKVRP